MSLVGAIPPAIATSGDLDPGFGSGGVVVTGNFYYSISSLLLQENAKLVALGITYLPSGPLSPLTLIRYNSDGTLDPSFGAGGMVVTPLGNNFGAAALRADGGIVVGGEICSDTDCRLAFVRYTADGLLDSTFGDGTGVVVEPLSAGTDVQQIVIQPSGRLVVLGAQKIAGYNADGSFDTSFGANGIISIRATALAVQPDGRLVVAGVVTIPTPLLPGWYVSRYDVNGVLDPTFGSDGVVNIPPPPTGPARIGLGTPTAIVVQENGAIVVGGWGEDSDAPGGFLHRLDLEVARLTATGAIDGAFGKGAVVITPIGAYAYGIKIDPFMFAKSTLALQSDGKIVQVGTPYAEATRFHIGVVRYNVDGTLDATFGQGGIVIGPLGRPLASVVQPDQKFVVAALTLGAGGTFTRFLLGNWSLVSSLNPAHVGENVTFTFSVPWLGPSGPVTFKDGSNVIPGCGNLRFPLFPVGGPITCTTSTLAVGTHVITAEYGGDFLNPPGPSAPVIQSVNALGIETAVEYYQIDWDHYFITSLPNEVAALDAKVFPGWERTGQSFAVYPLGAAQTVPVCRFFSGQSFAPKSSHFYTPYDFECDLLRQGTVWSFEGNVMGVQLADTLGNCPAGTRPLYRLYNNGQGGAPNHRYVTDLLLRSELIDVSWIPEGAGTIGVIACVPNI